jgi:hypothetical protein
VLEELPLVEVDSAELVSPGRVVTPGVVKPVDAAPGPLQAASTTSSGDREAERHHSARL